MTPQEALNEAARRVGSRYRLAKLLGISEQAIYQWQRVPIHRVATVAKLTGVRENELYPGYTYEDET